MTSDIALETAQRFLSALTGPKEQAEAQLLRLLEPNARFMRLGKSVHGAPAVADELLKGSDRVLTRELSWQAPRAVAADTVRLVTGRKAGTLDRGVVLTVKIEHGRIVLVQQQRMPPPPVAPTPVVLPSSLKQLINNALIERHPMLMAHVDLAGQPVQSFRGSVQAFRDDQLAMWIRNAEGAFIEEIQGNPKVSFVYRNEETKATYNFQGRARVGADEFDRQRVFDESPEAERAHDFAMLGAAVLVELDRVEGYAGLGPDGQVSRIRMVRGAVPI